MLWSVLGVRAATEVACTTFFLRFPQFWELTISLPKSDWRKIRLLQVSERKIPWPRYTTRESRKKMAFFFRSRRFFWFRKECLESFRNVSESFYGGSPPPPNFSLTKVRSSRSYLLKYGRHHRRHRSIDFIFAHKKM